MQVKSESLAVREEDRWGEERAAAASLESGGPEIPLHTISGNTGKLVLPEIRSNGSSQLSTIRGCFLPLCGVDKQVRAGRI